MEDFDDDFGDLYADVEAQASSAINGVPGYAPFCWEPRKGIASGGDGGEMNGNPSFGDEDGDGSESEDDLDIVLNEDCKSKSFAVVGRESAKSDENCRDSEDDFAAINELKGARTNGSLSPSGAKASLSNSMFMRSGWNHNVCDPRKGSIIGQGALVGSTWDFGTSQRRCYFSLPCYRSILDVNIDAFKEKPWKNPGVDITDFFNFGFNENSWKLYCNSLDQFRLSTLMRLGNPNHVAQNQASEAGCKCGEQVEGTMAENVCQPKGRAIQVEDSVGGRKPTVNVWRPRDRDSDVVIEINLEDTSDTLEKLDCSGSTPGKTPSIGELDSTNDTDFHHCNNGREDEFSVESLEENVKRVNRCSSKITASNPISSDPGDAERNQSHGIDENHQKKSFSSDGTVELDEAVSRTRDSVVVNACCADQSIVDRELSLEEEGQLSLPSSCFESDSEASRDDSHLDPGKVTSPIRRSSVDSEAELWESDASHQKNSNGKYAKIKPVDCRDYYKCKSSVQVDRKHRVRRVDCPGSDAEDMYDRDHLSVNLGGWKEKPQDIRDREDLAYYEESEVGYGGRQFAKNHLPNACKSYMNGSQGFHGERDLYLREGWNERRHLREDERRDGYRCQQGLLHRNMKNVAYNESGQWVSRYSCTREETDSQLYRKNNKLQSRKSTKYGSQFLDCKQKRCDRDTPDERYERFMQERYARSVSFLEQKRDTPDECYERQLLKCGKGLSERKRYNDASRLELEGSCYGQVEGEYWGNIDVPYLSIQSDGIEDKHWAKTDAHYLSNHYHRESDGGRWTGSISQKIGVSRSRFIRRYRRQLSPLEGEESGLFGGCNDLYSFEDGFTNPDDQDHFRRKRRFGWDSEVLSWTGEELSVRHQPEIINAKKSSFFFKSHGRHRRDYYTRASRHDAMHIDNMQLGQHGCKIIGDGSKSRCNYRTKKICRVKNEQAFPECRDSVDLIVGEGKLSGRCWKDSNLRFNSMVKGTDLENVERRIISMGFGESPRYKAVQSNLPKVGCNVDNEIFNDRFLVALQDDDLEIEEGQIVAEESRTHRADRIVQDSVTAVHGCSDKKSTLHDDYALHGSKTGGVCDSQRILETLAKMEKRRERFMEPITTLKKEQEKCPKPDMVPVSDTTTQTKQHRPVRKRQWCAQ